VLIQSKEASSPITQSVKKTQEPVIKQKVEQNTKVETQEIKTKTETISSDDAFDVFG
jgi:hypothetical protein